MLIAYSFLPRVLFRFTPGTWDSETAIVDLKQRNEALLAVQKHGFPALVMNGESALYPEDEAEYRTYFASAQDGPRTLALAGAFDGTTFNLPLVGMTTIWGGSGTAKTLLLDYMYTMALNQGLITQKYLRMIKFQEPEAFTVTGEATLLTRFELATVLTNFFAAPPTTEKVAAVDSLRALVYAADSGATGKGGMNMTLFSQLTSLSLIAERLGKGLITVINPLTIDQDALDMYETALAGSVNTAIRTTNPGAFLVTTRMAEVLPTRDARSYRFNVPRAVEAVRGLPTFSEESDSLDLARGRINDETFRRNREVR